LSIVSRADVQYFLSEDWFHIEGRGHVVTIPKLREFDSPGVLMGKEVIIDEEVWTVMSLVHQGKVIVGFLVRK